MSEQTTLTKKDMKSDQEVRWCPGCDDYAILSTMQGVLANLGIPREKMCIVSGIGCSSRFPYYMSTYGFHGIHGRAAAIATGVKIANPDLSVWVVTGDGDGLSIGGNHFIHAIRRNLDINILLFNNEIYGLTKGQYSPTSQTGLVTKASPNGTVERPFNPISVAVGAGGSFVARTLAGDPKHSAEVFTQAARHHGTSFVEIFQNCVIFNDGTFDAVAEKKVRAERTIDLVPGQPLVYGAARDKGLRFAGFSVERCAATEASVWDPEARSAAAALLLAEIGRDGDLPVPIGIFRRVAAPVYEEALHAQIAAVKAKRGPGSLHDLIHAGETWTVG
ncbi:MAG: 2-oxoacid:ferredoxin oxidoreductase subunit beta [Planctomycetota bacterium]